MEKSRVLFICQGNSVRSQMAEAILRYKGGKKFEVYSAGMTPAPVHRFTKDILKKKNMLHDNMKPQNILEFKDKNLDYIVVLSEVVWSILPEFVDSPQKLKWFIDDPIGVRGTEEKKKQAFEMTYNKIRNKIESYFL